MTKTAVAGKTLLVAPSLVAANRATLASLTASNVLGRNAPAIAETEAQYMEMWAQDASAMLGYEGTTTTTHAGETTVPVPASKAQDRAVALADLEKVDADVARDCAHSLHAYEVLTTLEKKETRSP